MLLKDYFTGYRKTELLDLAKDLKIRRYSRLRKAKLTDRIVEFLCSEEMMRMRFSCLTKEELELFRKAAVKPRHLSVTENVSAMFLNRYYIGCFEDSEDRFCIFEEMTEAFKKYDDKAMKKDQFKKGWMVKCLRFFLQYYGIAPIEVIYKMYKQRVNCTLDEMVAMMYEMPIDVSESCIIPTDVFGINELPEDDPMHSDYGILVHIYLFDDEDRADLAAQQRGKEFYIPSKQQIDELCTFGYEASAPEYKKLKSFFMQKLDIPYEQAVSWCFQVWIDSYEGIAPVEVCERLSESGVTIDTDEMADEIVNLFMAAYNATRIIENRGFKPKDMKDSTLSDVIPVAVPESPRVKKKIYPNDPCPCGSGKKYKKCCGRNT